MTERMHHLCCGGNAFPIVSSGFPVEFEFFSPPVFQRHCHIWKKMKIKMISTVPRHRWRCWSTSCRSPLFLPHRSYRWTCRLWKLPLAACRFPEWPQMTETVQDRRNQTINPGLSFFGHSSATFCIKACWKIKLPSCGNRTVNINLNSIRPGKVALIVNHPSVWNLLSAFDPSHGERQAVAVLCSGIIEDLTPHHWCDISQFQCS